MRVLEEGVKHVKPAVKVRDIVEIVAQAAGVSD
jgi:hypothetical protein